LPATGTLHHLVFPDILRVDSGVRAGDEVSPHFDPMIAKLVAHGPDREAAFARLKHALERTELVGVRTNLGFLSRLLDLPHVRSGAVETGLIGEHADTLTPDPEPSDWAIALAALIAAGVEGAWPHLGFTLWQPLWQTLNLKQGSAEHALAYTVSGRTAGVRIGNTVLDFAWHDGWVPASGPALRGRRDGAQITIFGHEGGSFHLMDPLVPAGEEGSADQIVAPMPGRVMAVDVVVGQRVARADRLAVLEAMKMEHSLRAGRDAVVADVLVLEGDQVEAGTVLARLEPETEAGT